MPDTPIDDIAPTHAFAVLKPDGKIDPDTVRATAEDACHDASTSAVVEVEVSLVKKKV